MSNSMTCGRCGAPIETEAGWKRGLCEGCRGADTRLGDVIEAHALPAIAGAILGLLLGLAIETPARQARAEQLAECQRVSAAQDRVILAASAQLDDALPLCSALADLQPVAGRSRGLR